MTTVKQAFEARLKRRVAAHPELYPQYGSKSFHTALTEKGNREALARLIEAVKGKPFWIFDDKQHEIEQQRHDGKCCFNDIIPAGRPIKNGIRHPLYDFQQLILTSLEQHRRVYLLKSGGIGASELFLRYMAYLCLSSDKYRDSQMVILTGPRLDLSISLVRRLKALFYPTITFEDKETVCELNQCRLEAFPSHAIHSARGLPSVSFIYADECDFWHPGQEEYEARALIERYTLKSPDCYVALISTPNRPEGFMDTLRKLPDEECQYKRLYMPYTVALNKLFTPEDVERARRTSPSFQREFCLSFTGQYGNVHSALSIDRAIELANKINPESITTARKSLGIDVGWGSSAMAFCLTQSINNVISVLYAAQYERPDYDQMLSLTLTLLRDYHKVNQVFIDSSAPEFISGLKRALHEPPNYLQHIEEIKHKYPNSWQRLQYSMMRVQPVAFSINHKRLLSNAKQWLDDDRNLVAIPSRFESLLSAIRTATAMESTLDKSATVNDDLYDSFRLSMSYWTYVPVLGVK